MYTQHLSQTQKTVRIEYEGKEMEVPEGITVAAAVLGHTDDTYCRHSEISHQNRAPYCLIGICHECFMEINDRPFQQSCMTLVEEGMKIRKQLLTDER